MQNRTRPLFYRKTEKYPGLRGVRISHMSQHTTKEGNRPAAVAGRFYPGTAKKLREEVESLFREAKAPLDPGQAPRALVVPHAGYVFSGRVAASGFNQIPAGHPYRKVFILASSHQMHFPGASAWCDGDYETPLGKVPVDRETCRLLARESSLVNPGGKAHLGEHSLEVQLPFLQEKLAPGFLLVPLILGTSNPQECLQLADILRPYFTSENLFVASSDLSHYPCYEDAVATDHATTEAILANDPAYLLKQLSDSRKKGLPGLATALCGWTSVVTLLHLTSPASLRAEWIDYANSGDEPRYGDHDRVVGYSAVAFFSNEERALILTSEDKQALLAIARSSVTSMVLHGKRNPAESRETDVSTSTTSSLEKPAGAFVSIYIEGKLRGCIGSFDTGDPLADVVDRSAASAVHDGRFKPLQPEELSAMNLEISVLTPPRKIHSPEEILPGIHGIYIKKGCSSGTFLPQVATHYGWDREELLGRCSRDKAGLGWEGWKHAELFVYEAIVFSDRASESPQNP